MLLVLRRYTLHVATVLALGIVLAASVWSADDEREAAIEDLSHEQAVLAKAVAAVFEHRLEDRAARERAPGPLTDAEIVDLLGGARRLEDRGELMVLVARPGERSFLTTSGRVVPSPRLQEGAEANAGTVTLPREEAVAFGLPDRRAVAGVATVVRSTAGPAVGRWSLAVMASTARVRAREEHEERRVAVTMLVAVAVVAAFGTLSRRRQRAALELEQRGAVEALEREKESALARADKMAALAALSTGIAHELGTPLSIIVGRVEQVVSRAGEDERTKQALGIVVEQVERIQRIVRGCLALARGDAPLLVRTSPAALATRAADLVRHRFDKAEVRLVTDAPADLPDVSCEPSLFEQALVNVLLNACHASPPGAEVRLSLTPSGRHVTFAVEDEGSGIPAEVAQRATEPFFSTRRDQGGSGLGLTIAREIVAHHGGELTIAKRSERGTRATLTVLVA